MVSRLLQHLPLLLLLLAAAPATSSEPAKIAGVDIGFDGQYKLGAWAPVTVTIAGDPGSDAMRLEITAPDGDGSPATVTTTATPDASGRVRSLVRVGRRDAVIRCRLHAGEQQVDQWRSGRDLDAPVRGLAVAETLVVTAGQEIDLADLPNDPLAYEGVDAVVVSGVAPDRLNELTEPQAAAIEQWVAAGGKIVIGGGEHAEALIGPNGKLRALSPGEFREVVRVSNTGVIEDYAGSEDPVDAPFGGLAAGRLDGVRGYVELHAGGRAVEMPLVVRTVHGFGSVTYVAFDLFDPAFSNWSSRDRLRSLLLQVPEGKANTDDASGALVTSAYSDLSGALQTQLGQQFSGVSTTSILMLVAAAGVYLALLGPGAYYLGKNVTGRMTTAWIAFPLIAIGVGGAAVWWGEQSTGATARLNKLEVIDIDAASGRERAHVWAQLLSPAANLYDLACVPADVAPQRGYLSWNGLPGRGLGGMQTSAESLLAGDVRYQTSAALDGMSGVPINRRASKSLTARWVADGRPSVGFELAATGTGLVEGVMTNDSGVALRDVKLIAGNWAWRLPNLGPGDIASIDAGGAPARLRTLLLNDFGDAQQTDRRLSANRLTVPATAYLMMFYDALGGLDTSPLPDFRQTRVDLSHALAAGRPILVARADAPRCELRQDVVELADPSDADATFYRFIGPPITEPRP